MGTVLRMVPTLLLLVISTALAAPRVSQDSMEGSEDNSDNSVDYSGGSEDNSDNFSDNSGNYTDYLDGPSLRGPTHSSRTGRSTRVAVLLSPPQTEL